MSVLDNGSATGAEGTVYTLELSAKNEEAQRIIKQLRMRLVRRTEMISTIRSYYLRDVVTIKLILNELLSDTERSIVMQQYMERLPSVDLKQALKLHAPHHSEMQIAPCELCGGKVEIIHIDSAEVNQLNDQLQISRQRELRYKATLAQLDSEVEMLKREKQNENKSHQEEVEITDYTIIIY